MSDVLITSLQKRIDELTAENATVKAEAKNRRIAGKKLAEELEALRGNVTTLTTERDGLDAKVKAAPNELQTKIDELQGQIRSRDHRDAFASVKDFEVADKDGKAKKYKLRDGVSIDDVWQLAQYKPEGEKPDGKAVSEQFGKALQAKPYLFAEATDEKSTTEARASQRQFAVSGREAGPGPGKGSESHTLAASNTDRIVTTSGRPAGRL